ncbi:MAG: hypothetical protein KDJ88_20170, partial [Bauldia sp.]|nr:hypothetical protein [Bauldia sp.]
RACGAARGRAGGNLFGKQFEKEVGHLSEETLEKRWRGHSKPPSACHLSDAPVARCRGFRIP